MAEEGKNPMEGVMAKLSATELQMLMRAFSVAASESTPRPVQRIDLPMLVRKLDGSASYLSWSRRVKYTLEGKDLEGYLTGDKNESAEGSPARAEWNSTHMTVYMWLSGFIDSLYCFHSGWHRAGQGCLGEAEKNL
jgi:hypothetical protein